MSIAADQIEGSSSPYAVAAEVYRDQGLSVIPCVPGDKFPGKYAAGQWWAANDWDKYCDRLPTPYETQLWDRWPDAGVCLALGDASAPRGKILVAVDIDTDNSVEVAAIKRALPGSPVAKVGRKGETQFYLANPCVVNRSYNDGNRRRMLDLLAHGRQTVMPPTMHPDGMRYRWITPDTLESFDVADLPMLPDDIGERLAEALKPFGYEPSLPVGGLGDADLDGDKVHRALNDAALEDLDAWVPALHLYNCTRTGDHYRAVAHWRPSSSGQPLAKRKSNLSIAPQGIRDFGDGDKGYTPLDLVMKGRDASLEHAFAWLQERVAPQKPVMLTSTPKPATERVQEAPKGNLAHLRLAASDGVQIIADATLGRKEEGPAAPTAQAVEAGDFDLASEPHLLGDIARFVQSAAFRPVGGFALPAALATLAALFGRRYCTPTGLGLNLYAVALADTGSGKEALLHGPKKLLSAASLGHLLGPGDFSSDSAIEFSLRARPSQLMLLDEFGKLAQAMAQKNAQVHLKLAAKVLLEVYTKSGPDNFWTGKQRADGLRDNAAEPIYSPTLTALGASTPSGFIEGITQANLDDGFLNRITMFPAGKAGPRQRDAARRPVSQSLLDEIRSTMEESSLGNLAEPNSRDPNAKVQLRLVPFADAAAEAALREVEDFEDDLRDANRHGVAGRTAEQTQKIATLRALGRSPAHPAVTAEDIRFAFNIVRRSIDAIERGALEFMADTDFAAMVNAARKAIAKGGEKGVTMRDLLRAPGLYGKEQNKIDAAIERLERLREIRSYDPEPARGRPSRRWRLLCEHEIDPEA